MQPENQKNIVDDEAASGIERMRRLLEERRQLEQTKRARERQTDEVAGNIKRIRLWVQQQRELTNAAEDPPESPVASLYNPPSELRVDEALNYVEDVKNTYIDQPDVFHEFLYTLQKAKYHILDRQGVLTTVAQLFVDHPRLIEGFNQFSPPDLQEAPPQPPATPLVDSPRLRVEQALNYVDDVKNTYINQPHIYQEFLCTMQKFKYHILDRQGVFTSVAQLFVDHPQLIEGFNQFLPPDLREVPAQPPAALLVNRSWMTMEESLDYFNDIKKTYVDERVYHQFQKTMNEFNCGVLDNESVMMRVSQLFRDNPRLIDGFKRFARWPRPTPQETFSSNHDSDFST